MAVLKKYRHIVFVPPESAAREAEHGLLLRKKFKRGGTMVGVSRARDLKNRRCLSPRTIKRMCSFFARHAVDKRGRNFFNSERPCNGFIAWLLWGGDRGKEWAEDVRQQMREADMR